MFLLFRLPLLSKSHAKATVLRQNREKNTLKKTKKRVTLRKEMM